MCRRNEHQIRNQREKSHGRPLLKHEKQREKHAKRISAQKQEKQLRKNAICNYLAIEESGLNDDTVTK